MEPAIWDAGGKVYMNNAIRVDYIARESVSSLAKLYYVYG